MPVAIVAASRLRAALNLVNTSTPVAVAAPQLRSALIDPAAPFQPHARILLEEAPAPLLADLVHEGFLSWDELATAAARYRPANAETAAWIRDMARPCRSMGGRT